MIIGIEDIILLGAYFLATLIIGLYCSKENFTFRSYSIGWRDYSTTTLLATTSCTLIGGNSLLGVIQEVHKVGWIFLTICLGDVVSNIAIGRYIAPEVSRYKKALTLGDIFESSYGRGARIITGILGTIYSLCVLSVQIGALSYLFQYISGITGTQGVIISSTIVIIYSVLGGIKSVVFTDILQFMLMIVIVPLLANYSTGVLKAKPDWIYDFDKSYSYIPLLLLFMLPSLKPSVIQRFLMARDEKQASEAMIFSGLIKVPVYVFAGFIAIAAKYYNPEASSRKAFFYLLEGAFSTNLRTIVILGIVAIIMSTADSELNAASINFTNDVIRPLCKNNIQDKTKVVLARMLTLILGILAILLVVHFNTLLEIIVFSKYFWIPFILFPLIAVLCKKSHSEFYIRNAAIMIVFIITWLSLGMKKVTGFDAVVPAVSISLLFYLKCFYKTFSSFALASFIFKPFNILIRIYKRLAIKGLRIDTNLDFPELKFLAVYILVMYSLPYFMWFESGISGEMNFLLRSIGIVLSGLVLAKEYVELPQLRNSICILMVLCNLIVFPTLIVILTDFSKLSMLNAMLSMVIAVTFLEWRDFLRFTFIGYAIAFIIIYYFLEIEIKEGLFKLLSYGYIYVFGVGMIFLRARKIKNDQVLEGMQVMGGIIAHEMRSPLSALAGNFKLLNKNKESDTTILKRGLLIIQRAQNSIELFLTNLKKQFDMKLEMTDLGNVIKEAITSYGLTADEEESLRIKPPTSGCTVKADKFLVKYIVINLLKNAFYQRKKHNRGQITIEIERNKLIISDNIVGIEKALLPNIFNNQVSGKSGGTGLGLAFCKHAIQSMGGCIECESEHLKYTKFIITFPQQV